MTLRVDRGNKIQSSSLNHKGQDEGGAIPYFVRNDVNHAKIPSRKASVAVLLFCRPEDANPIDALKVGFAFAQMKKTAFLTVNSSGCSR
jgi:hypothetical protein